MAYEKSPNDKLDLATCFAEESRKNSKNNNMEFNKYACSATGNPRNKTALAPGHSLMDWIRLGNSGKDLSGANGKQICVERKELMKHCTQGDAWMAIRGMVFNVTHYLDFHPGGQDELMRGVGGDATALFNAVHSWVNYESLLQKCIVGPLTANVHMQDLGVLEVMNVNQESIRKFIKPPEKNCGDLSKILDGNQESYKLNTSMEVVDDVKELTNKDNLSMTNRITPRFDWMQTSSNIIFIFYTRPFSNPYVSVKLKTSNNNGMVIVLQFNNTCHQFNLDPLYELCFPGKICVTHHTGKIELLFNKPDNRAWESYGKLEKSEVVELKFEDYSITHEEKIGRNTCIMSFSNSSSDSLHFPLGCYVLMKIKNTDIIRRYTPVSNFFSKKLPEKSKINMIIKRYSNGKLTSQLLHLPLKVLIKQPVSHMDIGKLEGHSHFLMLAAGTGIAPFLNLILYLLTRKSFPTHSILLIYYNREEQDILIKEALLELKRTYSQLSICFVLTKPSEEWTGKQGRVNDCQISDILLSRPTPTYNIVCGPPKFEENSIKALKCLNFSHICLFPN